MLDNEPENTTENTPNRSRAATAPPRRRRAATRPAGPPAPVDKPAETPATESVSAEAPAPKRSRRTAKKTVAVDGEEKPPTRRRRKAAEPEPVEPAVMASESSSPQQSWRLSPWRRRRPSPF